MLRRTFLTLIGAVAWPWRKKPAKNDFSGGEIRRPTGGTFTIRIETLDGVWHEEKFTANGERLSSVVVQPTERELQWSRAAQHRRS